MVRRPWLSVVGPLHHPEAPRGIYGISPVISHFFTYHPSLRKLPLHLSFPPPSRNPSPGGAAHPEPSRRVERGGWGPRLRLPSHLYIEREVGVGRFILGQETVAQRGSPLHHPDAPPAIQGQLHPCPPIPPHPPPTKRTSGLFVKPTVRRFLISNGPGVSKRNRAATSSWRSRDAPIPPWAWPKVSGRSSSC